MLATIGFDDQSRLYACEIRDVRRNRELTTEASAELVLPKLSP
jgi:hypothetical protein